MVVYRVRHRKDAYGKQFVILTYEEFSAIEQALANAEDLAALRAAKKEEPDAPSVPLEQVADEIGRSS